MEIGGTMAEQGFTSSFLQTIEHITRTQTFISCQDRGKELRRTPKHIYCILQCGYILQLIKEPEAE